MAGTRAEGGFDYKFFAFRGGGGREIEIVAGTHPFEKTAKGGATRLCALRGEGGPATSALGHGAMLKLPLGYGL